MHLEEEALVIATFLSRLGPPPSKVPRSNSLPGRFLDSAGNTPGSRSTGPGASPTASLPRGRIPAIPNFSPGNAALDTPAPVGCSVGVPAIPRFTRGSAAPGTPVPVGPALPVHMPLDVVPSCPRAAPRPFRRARGVASPGRGRVQLQHLRAAPGSPGPCEGSGSCARHPPPSSESAREGPSLSEAWREVDPVDVAEQALPQEAEGDREDAAPVAGARGRDVDGPLALSPLAVRKPVDAEPGSASTAATGGACSSVSTPPSGGSHAATTGSTASAAQTPAMVNDSSPDAPPTCGSQGGSSTPPSRESFDGLKGLAQGPTEVEGRDRGLREVCGARRKLRFDNDDFDRGPCPSRASFERLASAVELLAKQVGVPLGADICSARQRAAPTPPQSSSKCGRPRRTVHVGAKSRGSSEGFASLRVCIGQARFAAGAAAGNADGAASAPVAPVPCGPAGARSTA